MKESDVLYLAGVVDSIANLRVKVSEHNETRVGYQLSPRVTISRSGPAEVVIGMLDEYAIEHTVNSNIDDSGHSMTFEVVGRQSVKDFLEPIGGLLIQKHEQVELLFEEVFPALENGQHRTKQGFVEVMEVIDEVHEKESSTSKLKYTSGHFKQIWSSEL